MSLTAEEERIIKLCHNIRTEYQGYIDKQEASIKRIIDHNLPLPYGEQVLKAEHYKGCMSGIAYLISRIESQTYEDDGSWRAAYDSEN